MVNEWVGGLCGWGGGYGLILLDFDDLVWYGGCVGGWGGGGGVGGLYTNVCKVHGKH